MTQERSPVDAPPSASPRHGAQLERDAVEISLREATNVFRPVTYNRSQL
jgi:hypothetical protein